MKPLLFGLIAGTIWSLFPAVLSEIYRPAGQMLTVLAAGAVTGVAVSYYLLLVPVGRPKFWKSALLGSMSLPLGTFTFGVTITVLHILLSGHAGISYRFVSAGIDVNPFIVGGQYAAFSSLTPFVLLFWPLAILTTHMLLKGTRRTHQTPGINRKLTK